MAQRLSRWLGSLAACLGLSTGSAASAAETIVFQFGEFSRDVSVPSLVAFTETGTVKEDLRSYLKLLDPPARQSLRTALQQRVPVNAVMASNFLSTALGERVLEQVVKVIDQPPPSPARRSPRPSSSARAVRVICA